MRHNPSLSILRFPECVKETLSKDLRSIYTAPDKKTTLKRLEEVDKNWIYTKKVDTKQDFILHFSKHKGGMVSMTHRPYDEDFKKSIVALYQNGKTQSQLSKEYGVSLSAIGKWIRLYSEVKTVDGDIMTAKQIKDLQRRNAKLEEENLILKKAIAIFTPHSNND